MISSKDFSANTQVVTSQLHGVWGLEISQSGLIDWSCEVRTHTQIKQIIVELKKSGYRLGAQFQGIYTMLYYPVKIHLDFLKASKEQLLHSRFNRFYVEGVFPCLHGLIAKLVFFVCNSLDRTPYLGSCFCIKLETSRCNLSCSLVWYLGK